MKSYIALLAVAGALAALPGLASAATMRHDIDRTAHMAPTVSEATIMAGPVIPAGDDHISDIMNAEHTYLAQVCPTVLRSSGTYAPVLVSFCQQSHG
jgi:hypothetical protein